MKIFIILIVVVVLYYYSTPSIKIATPTPTPTNLQEYARARALYWGFPPDVFIRQITQESNWNGDAISSAGAIGIAQFMPSTAYSYGVDVNDEYSSLNGAAHMDSDMLRQFGDIDKALAAYNGGSGTVEYATSHCSYWRDCLPKETLAYITIIDS